MLAIRLLCGSAFSGGHTVAGGPLHPPKHQFGLPHVSGLSDFAHAGNVAKHVDPCGAEAQGRKLLLRELQRQTRRSGDKPATLALTFRTLSTLSGQAPEGLQDCDDQYREPPPRASIFIKRSKGTVARPGSQ